MLCFPGRAPSSVVEHLTFNQGVPGSIPGGPTILRSPAFGRELRMASHPPQPCLGSSLYSSPAGACVSDT